MIIAGKLLSEPKLFLSNRLTDLIKLPKFRNSKLSRKAPFKKQEHLSSDCQPLTTWSRVNGGRTESTTYTWVFVCAILLSIASRKKHAKRKR